ncbi:MAG: phospho-N-acetylmuramoyl-pentapeptide-transferase [Campylobacter sp.]|nr:phospho-N-acetylmuramoyl-pentapeptide-transferase [Campylobacter sp.]
MFYCLYEYFGINLFSYITVRAGMAFFFGFLFSVIALPKFIRWARFKRANQPIYELAPKSHKQKSKTPTMGGLFFTMSAVFASILCADIINIFVILGIITLMAFTYIGYKDDFGKIICKNNHAGLSPRQKMTLQAAFSLIIAISLFVFSDMNTEFYLPFYKFPLFDMKYFVVAFWAIVITASSNAVNLTDGLDGLATIPAVFALVTLGVFCYSIGNALVSEYLLLPKIIGVGEVAIVCAALIGSLLGFLWYNCYPAQIFMGDSGSLSIGAFIGYCGVVSKNELLLILIGFIFVMETISVILQVGSFKIFKKRVFLMAPIHHHFELKGWVENKIIVRFWIIALITNLIALASLKVR